MNSNQLKLSPAAADCVNQMVFVSGMPRTGTTVLGNLIGSFSNIDYHFEPPMIKALLGYLETGSLQANEFKFLFETYCFEELLVPHLAGRTLNFNTHDDSYIKNFLSEEELKKRLGKSHRKRTIEAEAKAYRLAIKMPASLLEMAALQNIYPEFIKIITYRNFNDVLHSILKKAWFAPEHLSVNGPTLLYPYLIYKDLKIPSCIPKKYHSSFVEADELHKAVIYYISQYEALGKIRRFIFIRYENFTQAPLEISKQLAKQLKVELTDKSLAIIDQIKPLEYRHEELPIEASWQSRLDEIESNFQGLNTGSVVNNIEG
ncbi:sulfotransferase [Marivirga sp. S37H4]|uniref:Sulfotransferase n=1 Tax=Marivirga aurantiaca TaxID=2802615 RepID=A0A935C6M1_9BACT|nr:sulfotransferase [Marivirga aurantiaca]MBK6264521.1 sulfotransferase [Marivirga aurantiaca]